MPSLSSVVLGVFFVMVIVMDKLQAVLLAGLRQSACLLH